MKTTELLDFERQNLKIMQDIAPECMVLLKSNNDFPIKEKGKIALYGSGVRHTVKGGSGSGDVNSRIVPTIEQEILEAGFEITTTKWLDEYDKKKVEAQKEFAKNIKRKVKEKKANLFLELIGAVMPEPEYQFPMDGEGDIAIYVLSRYSGEGNDRSNIKGDMYLSDTEIRDILYCQKKYKKMMLVLNTGGVVDLSPVMEVRNILLLSQLGAITGNSFVEVLLGKKYPSGKLTATWSGIEEYQNIGDFGDPNETLYKEGIYVGYKYFDTLDKKPLFPFGFGLNYTDFELNNVEVSVNKELVTVKCIVKNIGEFLGKETIQLYVSEPIEELDKPYQKLVGFVKSKELTPGEMQTVYLKFKLQDLASYDAKISSYILEKGNYILRVGNSSRNTRICGILNFTEKILVRELSNIMKTPSFVDWVPKKINKNSEDITSVKSFVIENNNFSDVRFSEPEKIDKKARDFVKKLSDEDLCYMCMGRHKQDGKTASIIGSSGQKVVGSAGETYQEVEGVNGIVMADGPAGLRLSLKYIKDKKGVRRFNEEFSDGWELFIPWYIRGLFKVLSKIDSRKDVNYQPCTAIPVGTAIAQSWNLKLAERCGEVVGNEMERFGIDLWLAPAINIQRDPKCGRNFEYYSEDPLISGLMGAAVTNGVQSIAGRGTCVKHFCCNNQEYNRTHSNSQVSERALREIYLKPFEICLSESKPISIMTSNNLVNGVHTAESEDLLKEVLRKEWGYQGVVMTDWTIREMANKEAVYPMAKVSTSIKAGNDLFMPGSHMDYLDLLSSLQSAEAEHSVTREEVEFCAAHVVRSAWILAKKN